MSDGLFKSFPYLSRLLGAYFHQDWSVLYDTVEETITEFVQVSYPFEIWGTVADVDRFLVFHGATADATYQSLFPRGPVTQGWGLGAKEWLEWIRRLLLEQTPSLPPLPSPPG